MVIIKDKKAIEAMTIGGRILGEALNLLRENIKPGVTTLELDQIFNRFCFKNNVRPAFKGYKAGGKYGFPASICASINEQVVHGLPSKRVIEEGDIVKIDAGITYDGYITDSAFTVGVGEISPEAQKLIEVTKKSLEKGISQVKEGARVGDISAAIGDYVYSNKMNVFKSLAGHGVGKHIHEEPLIPNYGTKGKGELLKAGMTLAIETMVSLGSGEMILEEDDWTLSESDGSLTAQFEHTVLVTESGYKILTTTLH